MHLQEYDTDNETISDLYNVSQALYQLSVNNKAMLADRDNYVAGPEYSDDEGQIVYKHAVLTADAMNNILSRIESISDISEESELDRQWKLFVLMICYIARDSNISNEEIARRTGLQSSNISRIWSLKYSPSIKQFLQVAKACEVNFFFESKSAKTELNILMERAMADIGRRPDKLPKN